jgi:hypothetical protein
MSYKFTIISESQLPNILEVPTVYNHTENIEILKRISYETTKWDGFGLGWIFRTEEMSHRVN